MESVVLVVSELATNSVRHANTNFQLKITLAENQVRIEVTDQGRGLPAVKTPPPTVPHGRGLQIVQGLTRKWGVVPAPSGSGKTVWCTVAI